MKDKQYTIQGVKLRMGVMTLNQDKKLLQLFKGKSIDFSKMTGGVLDLIGHLVEADLIEDFLRAILKGDVEKLNMGELTNDELEGIFTDFFELNGGWTKEITRLLELFPEADSSDDPFSELDEEDNSDPGRLYDRIIVGLAQGDIVKGLEIMEKVTIIQALNWLLMRMENE